VNLNDASRDTSLLLALELYRENKISLGRAAGLSQTPIEAFMVFAGKHEVPMHYSLADLEEDRLTLERLSS
jgi:predicted HTH domain antitoxin